MGNEKYLNYYVEILTSTMTDVVVRNISMQANERVSNELINEQAAKIEELVKNQESFNETITNLQNELTDLTNQKNNFENIKNQAQHVDTFRNELIKEREEHQKTRNDYEKKLKLLNEKIEYLQLTPAKRKKIDEANKVKEVSLSQLTEDTIKDGGSF